MSLTKKNDQQEREIEAKVAAAEFEAYGAAANDNRVHTVIEEETK